MPILLFVFIGLVIGGVVGEHIGYWRGRLVGMYETEKLLGNIPDDWDMDDWLS